MVSKGKCRLSIKNQCGFELPVDFKLDKLALVPKSIFEVLTWQEMTKIAHFLNESYGVNHYCQNPPITLLGCNRFESLHRSRNINMDH